MIKKTENREFKLFLVVTEILRNGEIAGSGVWERSVGFCFVWVWFYFFSLSYAIYTFIESLNIEVNPGAQFLILFFNYTLHSFKYHRYADGT